LSPEQNLPIIESTGTTKEAGLKSRKTSHSNLIDHHQNHPLPTDPQSSNDKKHMSVSNQSKPQTVSRERNDSRFEVQICLLGCTAV
jgi:hypothetical protein